MRCAKLTSTGYWKIGFALEQKNSRIWDRFRFVRRDPALRDRASRTDKLLSLTYLSKRLFDSPINISQTNKHSSIENIYFPNKYFHSNYSSGFIINTTCPSMITNPPNFYNFLPTQRLQKQRVPRFSFSVHKSF